MPSKQRIEYLDVAKFIGLVLVCFCHIPMPEGNFHVWVYSFHMPLFFIISGIFFSPDRFAIGKSAKQLLVPFALFNIIACVISLIMGVISTGLLQRPDITADFIFKSNYIIGPSWFLLSLFTIRVYCGIVLEHFKNICLVASALGFFALFCITSNCPVWDVFSIGSTVLGLPFFILGYYLRSLFIDERRLSKWWLPIAAFGISLLAIYNGQIGIHAHDFGQNVVLFIIFGFIGSILVITASCYVKIPRRTLSVFMDGALFIICFHTLIFEYLLLIWNKLTNDFSGNTLTEKLAVTALTFTVSYPLILLMLRYTPFLLGKPKQNQKTNVQVCR